MLSCLESLNPQPRGPRHWAHPSRLPMLRMRAAQLPPPSAPVSPPHPASCQPPTVGTYVGATPREEERGDSGALAYSLKQGTCPPRPLHVPPPRTHSVTEMGDGGGARRRPLSGRAVRTPADGQTAFLSPDPLLPLESSLFTRCVPH